MAATFGAGAADEEMIDLGFENGKRPLVEYPQKRPLIRVTTRPPQLETPFSVFNNGPITPNDAFFVRYHLTQSPPPETLLRPDRFRLNLTGNVKDALTFSMEDLRRFEPVQVTAVNQCSGNSRGFFKPRVAGGQMGNGAMGNAVWKGARLKDVLAKAGVGATAKQVMFNGLDQAILPQTPDFVKALDIDQAMDGETMLAYEMNGEALPWLNGYPLRLVVPGHYGTYWVKHLHEIKVIDEVFNGFWMNPGYRIPDNSCGCVEPGVKPAKTIPISRFNVRSFLTSLKDGDKLKSKQAITLRGIAFDGGYGITEVAVSDDEGKNWRTAQLGKDLGKYSFREWTLQYVPTAGNITLRVKATNRTGQSQPMEPLWNPSGYMRNVVETITVSAG
ncbi:MAG: oxidase [Verrucomicrobiales bacterium]|nr:oxidase [Verrucomicrobiales bacterium]